MTIEELYRELEKAEAAFRRHPSKISAGWYLKYLRECEAEGFLGDATFLNGLQEIQDYLFAGESE